MSDIKYDSKGSFLRPFKALAYIGRKPVTEPMGERAASANYRGFHVNNWEQCIGCGTCQKICDNQAITMVHIAELPRDEEKGLRPYRPAMDYGRCCWCGLCVDLCPTGSLALSREYIHTCTQEQIDSYFILPDPEGMHGLAYDEGWSKSDDSDLVDLKRQAMNELLPEERINSFTETVKGFDAQTALLEASRCIQCGMCHDACPTHMHAPEYIRAIWTGDMEKAVEEIYRTNPLAHVCGRVCTHRCESACSLGVRGEPIAIRWLKRYAMDSIDHTQIKQIAYKNKIYAQHPGKIAIIGAGPAGLTAAYDLAMYGHAVEIFDGLAEPGGMMRYGIPEYRMPYERIDDDIDVIRSMGVEIHCNTWVGRDITMQTLEEEYDAVVVAIGLHVGRSTRIPGADHTLVVSAIDILRKITRKIDFNIPRRAVIIGGGNVAMDVARSLLRLQQQHYRHIDITVSTLESREQMQAAADEIAEAEEEGVIIQNGRGPRKCVIEEDALTGLETVCCLSVFDDTGRFHPSYDEGDVCVYDADMVIEAIGQTASYSFLGESLIERLEWEKGRMKINVDGRTAESWLWAAGDAVEGPDVVHAIAGGHRVASSINRYLNENIKETA